MTSQEKALELYTYYEVLIKDFTKGVSIKELAKECALICVEEIILSAPFEPADTDWDDAGSSAQYWFPQKLEDSAKWWSEVKQEIQKL